MAVAIQLPALSPTMEDGRINKWLKKEGDQITPGMAIAECETDKSNLEIESTDAGTLIKIVVPEGGRVPVGGTIGWLGKPGEKVPDAPAAAAKPAEKPAAPAAAPQPAAPAPQPAAPAVPAPQAVPAAPPPAANGDGRVRSSPLARRIADEKGLDLRSITGSGPQGRIVKRDVEAGKAAASAKPASPTPYVAGVRLPPTELEVSGMRRTIAQRLGEVKRGVPHFYLTCDLEMDQALALKDEATAMGNKISVNDIIVKAVAVAVRRFPRVNQVFLGDRIQQLHNVDVGVAVAIEDGLVTPIVKDADAKSLSAIAAEIRELAGRAKKRALKPDEYQGGSITVSNLGMFGIDEFSAIINPPQSCILAAGKVEPRPVVRDGEIVVRQMMKVTLSADHRIVDGAVGAQFLLELRGLLEHPFRLLI